MEEMTREQLLLAYLRDKHCGGVNADLARKLEKQASYVNRLFYPRDKAGHKGIGLDLMRKANEVFKLPAGWWETFNLEQAPTQGELLGDATMPKPHATQAPAINGVPAAAMQLIALMAEIVEPMDEEGRSLAADAFAALLKNPQNQSRAALALAGAMANDAKAPPPSPSKKRKVTPAPKSAHARKTAAPKLQVKPGGGQQLLVERFGIRPLHEVVLNEHAGDGEQKMYKKIANYPKAAK